MIGNRFYTWFKNYYQWVGGAFSETLLLPLVRATAGLRAGAIRYDETTNTVETYDGTNWNPIPSATGFVPNTRTITINGTTFDLSTNRIYSVGTVTSVGLSMPAAFTVSGSPVTGSGTLSVAGAGLASQYVRGDGTLANFPTSQGGGSSVSYYLNGSVNQGTFGGSTYYEMNRVPILGAGTNFSRGTDGYIASFITDANDPGLTEIPGGNFNIELYFSASSGGGNPSFYVEVYKYDGTNFSLIASNQTSPDSITTATKDAYFTAVAIPQTALTLTDRLAFRVYVTTAGRTITLHTENNNLGQIITTFSTGINTINGLTKQVQFLTTGTGGTDFNINSTNSTHTFNIPTASATNRGALSSADWTTFNNKVSTSRQLTINGTAFDLSADRSWSVGTVTSVAASAPLSVSGSPTTTPVITITQANSTTNGFLSSTDWAIFNAKQNALTLTTTGNSGASTLVGATLNIPQYTLSGLGGVPTTRTLTINGTAFDLSANRSWSVGTVTSVGLTSATSGVTITDSPVTVSGTIGIAIATANGSQQGLLSSTDWTTFNNKQNALTLTTTGNSGASTLIGATLNVPEYTLTGLGGVPTTRQLTINGTAFDLSANRSWSVGTVTSVGLTSATSGVTITDSPVTVSGTIGIAIATANGSQQGLLSSTDWTTFNNKQNALTLTTTGTSGAATLIGATLNVPQYQAQGNYITSLTGEATASGPGAASVTLSTTAVTGKLLTGLNLSGGGTIAATDSILTAFGKVQNQISAMVGGVMYQGTWNASTNTPTLTSSVGVKGNYYIVDVSGTTNLNGITDWRVGDWAIFNGSTWDKVDNTDAVSSVNGFTGAVSLTTSHIAEGTNLYYTDTRARNAISLTTTGNSGAATYSSGVLNVPQYSLTGLGGVPSTRQLTINGTAFDLSADRSWSVGTVTSVGLSVPTGLTVANSPITGSGTLAISLASGYTIPTTATIDGKVPYSGATSGVNLGIYALAAKDIDINGNGTNQGGILSFAQYNASSTGRVGFTTINAIGQNNLWINFAQASAIRSAVLDSSSITDGAQRFYTLPNASGTLALTSNINSAVSGSTGQVAYFSGTNSVTGESNLFWDAANDRLGIGVTPSARLHISSNAASPSLIINNASSGWSFSQWEFNSTPYGYIGQANSTFSGGSATDFGIRAENNLTFGVVSSERMRITSGGNVGIGTTTPNLATANIGLSVNSSDYSVFELNQNNARAFYIYSNSSSSFIGTFGAAPMIFRTSDTERMRIHSNGGLKFNPQSAAPTAEAGTVYYDSDDNKLKVYNGTSWVDLH